MTLKPLVPGAAAVAICLAFWPAVAAEERWTTYSNERFGTTIDLPGDFAVREPPPANGDGQRFRTRDGQARLSAWGSLNALDETPQQMMDGRREAGTAYSYAVATGRWFVLSGAKDGRITYTRCALSTAADGIVGCVELEYPQAETARWAEIVARVSRSLRFGRPW